VSQAGALQGAQTQQPTFKKNQARISSKYFQKTFRPCGIHVLENQYIFLYGLSEAGIENYCYESHARSDCLLILASFNAVYRSQQYFIFFGVVLVTQPRFFGVLVLLKRIREM
jgi:hypothetical protein